MSEDFFEDGPGQAMKKTAIISPDGRYRYILTREWDKQLAPVSFIMLNPSTADAYSDDPTIRKCIGFAKHMNAGSIAVLNLFALRSTKPKPPSQWTKEDVGDQDYKLWFDKVDNLTVIVAWGAGAPDWRVKEAVKTLGDGRTLYCLGTTATGAPKHPLYVPYAYTPTKWRLK